MLAPAAGSGMDVPSVPAGRFLWTVDGKAVHGNAVVGTRGRPHRCRALLYGEEMALTTAQALDFLSGNSHAVLVTRRRDGSLQMSPLNAGVLDGHVVISSRTMLAKVRNLRRNPAASVLVTTDRFYGPWVQVDGTAEIIDQSLPGTVDLLVDVYRAIAGEHPNWDEYREAMVKDERVVIRIRPERASGQL
jgi:PPOX class probable F420-dependent enzyme